MPSGLLIALAGAAAHGDESVAPYVPTPEEDVALMLDVGRVGPGDHVIDLGSGDGRIVIGAAERGGVGHGVELDPELVERSAANARNAGVADRVTFVQGDIFDADIGAATVVTLYLFPDANLRLRPKLLAELRPGTRVVSNSFHMGEWPADEHDMSSRSSGGILLWIVPARVEGDWTLELEGGGARYALAARQRFQQIELSGTGTGTALEIGAATLHGERIAFDAESADARYTFSGRVAGDTMDGYAQIERPDGTRVARWTARRVRPEPR